MLLQKAWNYELLILRTRHLPKERFCFVPRDKFLWGHGCPNLRVIYITLPEPFSDGSQLRCAATSNRFTVLCHVDPPPPSPARRVPPPATAGPGKCRPLRSPGLSGLKSILPPARPFPAELSLELLSLLPSWINIPHSSLLLAHTAQGKSVGHVDVSAAAGARVCRAPRTAGSRGEAGGGRTGRKETGGGGEGVVSWGYLDSVGRLLESDQHVPVSPAGRVPGSELRRGGQSRGWAERRRRRRSPLARPGPPLPPRTHTHSLGRSCPPSPRAPGSPSLPAAPSPPRAATLARFLSPPLARQSPVPSWKSLQRLWLCPDRWCPDGCAGSWRRTCLSGRVRWA